MTLQLAAECVLLFVCCIDYFGGLFLFTVVWLLTGGLNAEFGGLIVLGLVGCVGLWN